MASIDSESHVFRHGVHCRPRAIFRKPVIADFLFQHFVALDTDSHAIALVAFVAMPDHVHAAFTLRADNSLAAVMKQFRGRTAAPINRVLRRTGPVWERGYFDRLLRLDESLEPVLHYMWHNPTPAGKGFHCRAEIWTWFRTCVRSTPEYYDWLKQNP